MELAAIPSPTTATWNLGPIPIRAYALFIILGIIVACIVTEYRLRARGVHKWAVLDIAVWAVPAGIIGARIYHVITSPDNYFGAGGDFLKAFRVWEGGLGIWGAIAGGALGVWFGCRQMKLPFLLVADAAAVGIPLAQAVGRLGNWFNNELYGSETTLPWGLEVHRMVDGQAEPAGPDGSTLLPGLYHPTFLYELLWNVGAALLVLYLGRRLSLGRGRAFALYVMAYTAGRFWIEMLRIDDTAEQPGVTTDTVTTILGQRVNVWVSLLVFLGALAYFLRAVPLARGPQEFVVPLEDGSGYRVVTEQEYRDYEPPVVPATPAGAEPDGTKEPEPDTAAPEAAAEPGGKAAAPDGKAAAPEGDGEPEHEGAPEAADGEASEVGSSSSTGSGAARTDDK